MHIDIFLDQFCNSALNRTWAIMKALNTGVGHNELAFYALVQQYHAHPNKKRWNCIFKIFLMARNGSVEAAIRNGTIAQLPALSLKYYIDPENGLSMARQTVKTKYKDEIFPDLLKTFEKGDPAKGRKKLGKLEALKMKATAYKRKVNKGDFDPIIDQITRSGGPIDRFAQSIGTYPDTSDLHSGSASALLRGQIYNASHGAATSETKEHWLTNLQTVLPQYDLDPDDAGLGCDIHQYIG